MIKGPLTEEMAKKKLNKLFSRRKAKFKLSTHANGTLTISEMRSLLSTWEKQEGFIPDVIIIDYADLLEPEKGGRDYRHQLNEIWKGMRRMTEEQHCLLVTATQADAQSYGANTLRLKNFSEDKRKLSHVTAMYGLNQDPQGRERRMGILRVNELVVREDELESKRQVKVLQRLQIGRPVCGSFF
jgi:replicative DNA helicase